MVRYPVLHSGFVAHTDVALVKTEYNSNPFVENVLFTQSGNNEFANLFFSKEITELYKNYQTDTSIIRDIDVRERILKLAAINFGRAGITEWTSIQNKFAKVSYAHLEYILDTIGFIVCGKRNTSPAIWENLIRKTSAGPFVELEKSEELRLILKDVNSCVNGGISIQLNSWVGHLGGYEDLLYTLWLIFGDKSYAHSFTTKLTTVAKV